MIFAEKKMRQEERKETEMKEVHGKSRSTIRSSEASPSMEYSTSTVDHSDEEMEEDADETGSESNETWAAPYAVDCTASGAVHVSSDSDLPNRPPPHLHILSPLRPNDP